MIIIFLNVLQNFNFSKMFPRFWLVGLNIFTIIKSYKSVRFKLIEHPQNLTLCLNVVFFIIGEIARHVNGHTNNNVVSKILQNIFGADQKKQKPTDFKQV